MEPVTGRPESAGELRGERKFTGLQVFHGAWCDVGDQSVLARRSLQGLNMAGQVQEGFLEAASTGWARAWKRLGLASGPGDRFS